MNRTLALLLLSGLALSISPTRSAFAAGDLELQPAGDKVSAADKVPAAKADIVPITRITLYRSGVGYFMRQGTISDNAQISLKFDAAQINDVLKSLQVLDFGGRVASVSYPSKDPLSRRLNSFSLNIGDNPSLPVLLERLRGSAVTLTTVEGSVTGSVLSVETREIPQASGDKPVIVKTPVVNLVTAAGIKAVPVPTITNFVIADKALAEELNRALTALAESRAERTKQVDVSLAGTGARQLAMAYVHETPVWKTSYRLVLPEADAKPDAKADAKKPAGQGVLQGWAIVENTTDQDWANVKLSLVSGRPVSFKMDLYEPLYVYRPEVAVPTVPGVMPRTYEGGAVKPGEPASPMPAGRTAGSSGSPFRKNRVEEEKTDKAKNMAPASARMRGGGDGGDGEGGAFYDRSEAAAPSASDMVDYAARPGAKAGEVGEVFQFELENPVTIERQRSAMIPILTSSVAARRVSIYNQSDRADHPMRGVEITNSTDLQLLPGPLSVMDSNAYAGDAQINQISPGDKRLLAYAVDLDVAVTTEPVNVTNLVKIKIVQGSMVQTSSNAYGTKYTFANKDIKRPRTIVLEHPKLEGFTLKGETKPVEQTQGLYRFDVAVETAKQSTIEVVQERVYQQTIGIFNYDYDTLVKFQQAGKLSPQVLSSMQAIFQKQAAVNEAERKIGQFEQQIATLRADQTRISQNMATLDRQTKMYGNFLAKLDTQEKEIDKLTALLESTRIQLDTYRKDLDTTVANLSVE